MSFNTRTKIVRQQHPRNIDGKCHSEGLRYQRLKPPPKLGGEYRLRHIGVLRRCEPPAPDHKIVGRLWVLIAERVMVLNALFAVRVLPESKRG